MGRKGLRVTGPMITRARISKRDPFLFYPREGSVFLARYPLQGITNWRWSQSPRFAELLAETMARTSSKSSVIEKDGKVARLLERSFLLQHRPEPPFAAYPCNMDSRRIRRTVKRFVALTIVSKTRRRHNALSFFERSSTNPLHL